MAAAKKKPADSAKRKRKPAKKPPKPKTISERPAAALALLARARRGR